MTPLDKDRILQFRGGELHDRDGERLGKIEEIYLDAETREPQWALVHTGLFGTKRTFVPLREASEADGELRVPLEQGTVKDAPQIEANGQISEAEETELHRHYGLEQSTPNE